MAVIVIQDQDPKPAEAKAEEVQAEEVQAAQEVGLTLGQTLERQRTLETAVEEIKAALASLKAQAEAQAQAIQKLALIDELILRVQALETDDEEEVDHDEIQVPIPAEKAPQQEQKKEKPGGMISKVFLGR